MSNVVIVGAGYAGLSVALELRRRLPSGDSVTLVSPSDRFIFYPSLIWVVQGERDPADITFPIAPVLDQAGVTFVQDALAAIDPAARTATLQDGRALPYDKLLLATGGEWAWDAVPGSAPKPAGHTVSILSPQAALNARADWQALLDNPGPIVIGLALGASLYGAAYEFALNLDVALRQAGLRDRAPIVFLTPEPYVGHFGHDGLGNSRHIIEEAFRERGITYLTEAQIARVEEGAVVLADRRSYPARMAMIVPPYRGIAPVRQVPHLTGADGRVPVDEFFRSVAYPDIFAAGVAAQNEPVGTSILPLGVLVPGTASAEMGRVAAANLAADLGHGAAVRQPPGAQKSFYVLDSGGWGLFLSLGAQSWLNVQLNVPGPWSHWAKQMTERYQMWQLRTGRA